MFRLGYGKRHQCHQLYVLLGYEIISIKYVFASARKYVPPSLGYEFISINSINNAVVSASLFVSASLRLGYGIIPISFQTYLMNNSQTDPLIVKCPSLALLAFPAYHMLLFHFCVWYYVGYVFVTVLSNLTKFNQHDNGSH